MLKTTAMKNQSINIISFVILLSIAISINFSCNKSDGLIVVPTYLDVDFPLLSLNYDRYYSLNHDVRSIELVFSQEIKKESVSGNLIFSDSNGHSITYKPHFIKEESIKIDNLVTEDYG